MNDHIAAFEQRDEIRDALAEVVDPDRRIGENQTPAADRLLGTGVSCGCVPPSFASRRALSRSIRALSPSRNTVERSCSPVSLTAFESNSTSKVTVVRIAISIRAESIIASFGVALDARR